jgi:hypothetical protein
MNRCSPASPARWSRQRFANLMAERLVFVFDRPLERHAIEETADALLNDRVISED